MALPFTGCFGTIPAYKRHRRRGNQAFLDEREMLKGEINMKARLQHFLHPLNLWCRVGGHASWCFKLYENWLWQPLLRELLSDGSIQTKEGV